MSMGISGTGTILVPAGRVMCVSGDVPPALAGRVTCVSGEVLLAFG